MAEIQNQMTGSEDDLSVKEHFKYSVSHYMTSVLTVIIIASALAVVLSVCTDIMYDTNIFHVPVAEAESVGTAVNSFTGNHCSFNISSLEIRGENVYAELSAAADGEYAEKLRGCRIMLVRYGIEGCEREFVCHPASDERTSSVLPDGSVRTDCSLVFFAPDNEEENEGYCYCIRIDTKTDEGLIDIIYND